jgi:hypothetical protein
MEFLSQLKEFGPWVLLVAFLVWRDWQRETRAEKRSDRQWDELAKLQRKSNEVLVQLTDVLRARPCLADGAHELEPHAAPSVPHPATDSTRYPLSVVRGLLLLLGLLALLACVGCGDVPPDRSTPAPPAAAEVADLRAQEIEAGTAAARALAAGDTAQASYQSRLAAELGKLRAAADERARVQAAEIAAMQAAADRDAQARQDAATRAADTRRARIVAGVGSALCVAAGALGVWFGLARLAVPLAGVGVLACMSLFAFAEATRGAWLAPVLIGAALLGGVAWVLVRRRDAALQATATLGDAFETGVRVLEAKARAKTAQVRAGVHTLIERHRKPPARPSPDHG